MDPIQKILERAELLFERNQLHMCSKALDEIAERFLIGVRLGSVDARGLITSHRAPIERAPHAVKAALGGAS